MSASFRATPAPIAAPRGLSRAAMIAFAAAAAATGAACSQSATPVYGAPVMDTGIDASDATPTDSGVDANLPDAVPIYGAPPFDTGTPEGGR